MAWTLPQTPRSRRLTAIGTAVVTLLSGCSSPPPRSPIVTEAEFVAAGKLWPLTIAAGEVGCTPNSEDRRGDAVWFKAPDGTQYGLNSYASAEKGFADLIPIWAEDEKMNAKLAAAFPGQALPTRNRLSIGDLAERAFTMCYSAKLKPQATY